MSFSLTKGETMKKVCVIAVHPDDETLGCGGAILKHLKRGDEVHCVFITDGDETQKELIDQLAKHYGFSSVTRLGMSELKLADMSLNELVPALAGSIKKIEPNVLYIPNRSDAHSDHRAVFEALIACTKAFRFPSIEQILMCEVISETDFNLGLSEQGFNPNYFVDITDEWGSKKKALKICKDQMLPYPFTRNESTMEALNRYRGSLINTEYAEAFMALKIIVR